jgi:hypothetical protein
MRLIASTLALLMSAGYAGAQTAPPVANPTPAPSTPSADAPKVSVADAALEIRASQAFNKGDYAQALPMLQKLASELKSDASQADKLGMVQEQIRVCEKNKSAVTSVGSSAATPGQNANGADAKPAARTPHPAPKEGEVLDLAIKDLGNFEYDSENGSAIPEDVKALNGATVRLHGFMIPMDQAENISKFALVPSLFNCCYGQPPQVQHTIVVTCPKGKAVNYYPDEIIVQGKLSVNVIKDDGYIVSIFQVETSSVKPSPK